jgi:hypothetical protein
MTEAEGKVTKLHKTRAHQLYRLADGSIVPGASTIAKIGEDTSKLRDWAFRMGHEGLDPDKLMIEAANIGSIAHFMLNCRFKGETPDLSDYSPNEVTAGTDIFNKFWKSWASLKLTLVASEIELVSETYRYGGTLDTVGRNEEGLLVLVDWKSTPSIYVSHYKQIVAYEKLWDENMDETITKRCIVRQGKKDKEDSEIRWIGSVEKYFNVFLAQLKLHQAIKALNQS